MACCGSTSKGTGVGGFKHSDHNIVAPTFPFRPSRGFEVCNSDGGVAVVIGLGQAPYSSHTDRVDHQPAVRRLIRRHIQVARCPQ